MGGNKPEIKELPVFKIRLIVMMGIIVMATMANAQDNKLGTYKGEKLEQSPADIIVLEEILDDMQDQSALSDEETALMGKIEDLLLNLQATKYPFVTKEDKKTILDVIKRLDKQLQAASPTDRTEVRRKQKLVRALKARTEKFAIVRLQALPPSGPPQH